MNIDLSQTLSCGVIGYGSWATALVKILLENEKSVAWHIKNSYVLEEIATFSRNPKYLSSIEFDTDKLMLSEDVNDVVRNSDIIILAVPSAFLSTILEPLTESLKNKFIITAIKGIVPDTLQTIAEFVNTKYDLPFSQIGVITGPCHAEEVALERLSYLNIVASNLEIADHIAYKFRTPYININTITDIYGAEYSAVLKNIYALAVGIAIGIGYGDNFIAVLISNAANEMAYFMNETYPFERNLNSSPYLGDLLVTSYSQFSRNRTFGVMIGKGYSVIAAQMEMNMVAEGYYAAKCINSICIKSKIQLPIAQSIFKILYQRAYAKLIFKDIQKKLL